MQGIGVEVGAAPRAALGAKVQIGLRPVQKCKSERRRYGWRVAAPGGRWRGFLLKGKPETGWLHGGGFIWGDG